MREDEILKQTFNFIMNHFKISIDDIEIILLYGNKQGEDIDLLVVLPDSYRGYSHKRKEYLDVFFCGKKTFVDWIKKMEPIITEPILTGTILLGKIEKYKKQITQTRISKKIRDNLILRAKIFYSFAKIIEQNNKMSNNLKKGITQEQEVPFEAIENLRFSLSYMLFAEYYKDNKKVITFKKLKKKIRNKKTLLFLEEKNKKHYSIMEFEELLRKVKSEVF
ncbi:hypothetical protein ISS06_00785 [Patescibacteria group bacterium]|nr:hypothetical protein [Patescibacteria group bacterium]